MTRLIMIPPAWLLMLALAALTPLAWGMDMAEAEARALELAPRSAALHARADALRDEAHAAGALPDPELSLGYQGLPVDSFSTRDEMMTMFHLSVRQRLPALGSRALLRDRGRLQAEQVGAEEALYRLQVRREIRELWLDWRVAVDAVAVVSSLGERMEALEALVERRVAAGTAERAELSRARLERKAVREQLLEWKARAESASAQLEAWVAEPLSEPGQGLVWPDPDRESLVRALERHPEMEREGLDVRLGETRTELARTDYRPSWMVELGYGWRRGSDPMTGQGRSDLASAMVSMSLPIFTGGRQDRRLAAARADTESARFELADRRRDLLQRLGEQLALWQRQAEVVDWYQDALIPAAIETRAAQLDAWRNNRAELEALISAELDVLRYRLRALGAARQRDAARVALRYLEGV